MVPGLFPLLPAASRSGGTGNPTSRSAIRFNPLQKLFEVIQRR